MKTKSVSPRQDIMLMFSFVFCLRVMYMLVRNMNSQMPKIIEGSSSCRVLPSIKKHHSSPYFKKPVA